MVVGHDHRLAGEEHLPHDAFVDPEPLADHLVANAVAGDDDRKARVVAVTHADGCALDVQDAARLLGHPSQERGGLAAAAHDPGGVGEGARTARELGDLGAGLEQPTRPDQDDARGEGQDRSDQPVRPELRVDRLAVPDVVEAHRGRGQQGDHEDAELVVSRVRHARQGAQPLLLPHRRRPRGQLEPRGGRPAGGYSPEAAGRAWSGSSGSSAWPGRAEPGGARQRAVEAGPASRRPGGPSPAGRRSPACRRGCRSRGRPWPRGCRAPRGCRSRAARGGRARCAARARARSARESGDPLDLRAHEVVAERDLAEQLAVVGEVDRERVAAVGLDLADVVDQRAGDGDVAVDAGERAPRWRSRPGPPRASARAARAGMPGGRTSPPAPCGTAATPRRPRRTARRAARAGTGCAPSRSAAAGRPPSGRRSRRARPSGRRGRYSPSCGRGRGLHHQLGAVAVGDLEAAAHADRRAGLRRARAARGRRPRRRRRACRCSRTASASGSPAVALLRERALLHEQHRLDVLRLAQVAHEQRFGRRADRRPRTGGCPALRSEDSPNYESTRTRVI